MRTTFSFALEEHFMSMLQPLLITAPDGEILRLNDAARGLFGERCRHLAELVEDAPALLDRRAALAPHELIRWRGASGSLHLQTTLVWAPSSLLIVVAPLEAMFVALLTGGVWAQVLSAMQVVMYALDRHERVTAFYEPDVDPGAVSRVSSHGAYLRDITDGGRLELAHGELLPIRSVNQRVLRGEVVRGLLRGQHECYESCIMPMRAHDGEIIGMIGLGVVVTERQRELEYTQRLERLSSAALLHYEEILDHVEDPIFSFDQQLTILGLNAAAREFSGITQSSVGKPLLDVFPHLRGSMFEGLYRRVLESGTGQQLDYHDEPKQRWLHLRVEPRPHGIDVQVRDVTRTYHAARALADFFTLSDQLMCIADTSGKVLEANRAVFKLCGLDGDDLQHRGLLYRIIPEDRPLTVQAFQGVVQGRHAGPIVVRMWNAKKELRHIEWSAVLCGERLHLVGRDVTNERLEQARRAADLLRMEALARELSLLRAAVSQVNDILVIAQQSDGEGIPRIIFANEALARLVGQPHESLAGRALWFFIEDQEAVLALRSTIWRGVALRREFSRRGALHKDTRYFELDLIPLSHGIGFEGGWAMLVRDISQMRQLDAELRAAQRLESVGTLTGGLAHDFNNVLTSIVGFVEFGIESAQQLAHAAGPAQQESAHSLLMDLGEVHHAALKAGDLVKRMLSFSSRRFVQRGVFDVTASLIGMERMLRRLLPSTIQLDMNIPRQPCMTMGDPVELEQVVMNLAINARDAMPRGGQLTISLRLREDSCALTVQDAGQGIPNEILPSIFDPFFTTKEPGRGTGLGLAMVHSIVARMEGSIQVQSETTRGTCFTVELPRYHTPPSQLAAAPTLTGAAMGELVLLVEDDPFIRQLTRRMLEEAGYRTLAARTAEQALELIEDTSADVDLVITDLILVGMSGWELAEALRKRNPRLPILLCSGYAPEPPADFKLRDLPMLPKPFGHEALLAQLRHMLDGSSTYEDA